MGGSETNPHADAATLALDALVWTLRDGDRADWLLALTGLTPAGLRARLAEPAIQAAALTFLESHEPDLIACADALGIRPETLVAARAVLENR